MMMCKSKLFNFYIIFYLYLTKLEKDSAKYRLYIIITYTIYLYISNHCNVCRSLKVSISSISKQGGMDGIITSYSIDFMLSI